MTGKSNENCAEDLATSNVDAAIFDRSLGYRTRVATIVVSVVVMLFCAIFWQSVLDFRSKFDRKPLLDELAAESYDELDEPADVVEQTDDWREQLAALYPREEFESDAARSATDAANERAARFNAFALDEPSPDALAPETSPIDDEEPLPPAPSVAKNVRDEVLGLESPSDVASSNENAELNDDALVDAARFDSENDEPLPAAPRAKRSAYAADDDPLPSDPNDAPEDSAILADLPTVDPSDPLGLESASSLESDAELPAAPGASLVGDAKSRVAFAGYSALAESPVATTTEAVAETLAGSSSALENDVAPEDETFDDSTLAVAEETEAAPEPEPVARPSKAELEAVADAVFAPSYFSRAVGLFGGQDAFSALYFARAAQIVSDSASWSPDSWSHIAPIAVSGAPTPKKTQTVAAPEEDGASDVGDEPDSNEPIDDATAAAIRAKYPTLVGYIERRSIKSPAPLSTAEPNQSATPAIPAGASGALQ